MWSLNGTAVNLLRFTQRESLTDKAGQLARFTSSRKLNAGALQRPFLLSQGNALVAAAGRVDDS